MVVPLAFIVERNFKFYQIPVFLPIIVSEPPNYIACLWRKCVLEHIVLVKVIQPDASAYNLFERFRHTRVQELSFHYIDLCLDQRLRDEGREICHDLLDFGASAGEACYRRGAGQDQRGDLFCKSLNIGLVLPANSYSQLNFGNIRWRFAGKMPVRRVDAYELR